MSPISLLFSPDFHLEVHRRACKWWLAIGSPAAEGNHHTRAARVLAMNKIDVKPLADRAYMSESTAER